MKAAGPILRVAVPVPLYESFDYRWPGKEAPPPVGARVRVPFGRAEKIGIVVGQPARAGVAGTALKAVHEAIDAEAVLDPELFETLRWCASYYHHPLGEVLTHALPALLRRGRPQNTGAETIVRLTGPAESADEHTLGRAPRQAEAVALLHRHGALTRSALRAAGVSADTLRRLAEKSLISVEAGSTMPASGAGSAVPEAARAARPTLTPEQRSAVAEIAGAANRFAPFMLFGVTGSGKTEVFLRSIENALGEGRQTLLLVPEISLTPQLVRRLTERFGTGLVVVHSGLADGERLAAWRAARAGTARLIVGTRSAVFSPLPNPGLIIVDEEHDPSFKQQTGLRYSARDLAVVRARALGIPIVLASATPSLETFSNARAGRYRELTLPKRIGTAGAPRMRIVDMNRHASRQGLSTPLLSHIERHLGLGSQVMLFINRRGFAPVLFCPDCDDVEDCPRCDAHLTVHARAGKMRCHHCGRESELRWPCPRCGTERIAIGEGTQRVTEELAALYPEHPIARLDSDALTRREALGEILDQVESGRTRIIVGTQLLAKGHDFPGVTLVGILNADQGLFGTDFRAEERLAQTIVQVAGRAGRREQPGDVVIQTHFPNHPLLTSLTSGDYAAFADAALAERRESDWPPYSKIALWRAEATKRQPVFDFLQRVKDEVSALDGEVAALGPATQALERLGGRYRGQLMLKSSARPGLHAAASACLQALRGWPETRRVRWSLDIDPIEI